MHASNSRIGVTSGITARGLMAHGRITDKANNRIGTTDHATVARIVREMAIVLLTRVPTRIREETARIATGTVRRTIGGSSHRVRLNHNQGPLRPGWRKHPVQNRPLSRMSQSKQSGPGVSNCAV
ncbi:hypothetical protein GCM10028804_02940 [Larkinella terrae]